MRLQLTVRQTGTMPEARDEVRRIERFPFVIGRSSGCDLVLHDESRFISSNHAILLLVDDQPCIRDTSANGVFLNGSDEALGRGKEVQLRDRDTVGVGDYVLTVAFEPGPGAGPADPFASLLDGARGPAGRNGAPSDAPFDAPDEHGGAMPGAAHDPWFGAEPDWMTPPETPAGEPARATSASTDDPFAAAPVDDWADWASDPPSGVPPPSPGPAAAATPPTGHHPVRSPDNAAPADAALEPLLLQCVEGLMALLRSRSELKQAMRTDVTSLRGTGNNPLKFSRDGGEALTRLLEPPPTGDYLAPEVALAEAIDDLVLHEVAMLEGMKGAVDALLARFDPDSLTGQLTADHPIAATIPVTRDARLWRLFREHYADIEQAARGDFTAVFGREFRKAYEARIRALGREPDFW